MGEQANTPAAASVGAQVVFDLSRLREPRGLLLYARQHLAIVRDEDVDEDFRTDAAETANRIARRAGNALIHIRDDASTPLMVRRLVIDLIDKINVILRESYAWLYPDDRPRTALVVFISAEAALVAALEGFAAAASAAIAARREEGRKLLAEVEVAVNNPDRDRLTTIRAMHLAARAAELLDEWPDEKARAEAWSFSLYEHLIAWGRPWGRHKADRQRYRLARSALRAAPRVVRDAKPLNDARAS